MCMLYIHTSVHFYQWYLTTLLWVTYEECVGRIKRMWVSLDDSELFTQIFRQNLFLSFSPIFSKRQMQVNFALCLTQVEGISQPITKHFRWHDSYRLVRLIVKFSWDRWFWQRHFQALCCHKWSCERSQFTTVNTMVHYETSETSQTDNSRRVGVSASVPVDAPANVPALTATRERPDANWSISDPLSQ